MKLFIDDIRDAPDDSYIIAKSYHETLQFFHDNGCPEYISFDHDLGQVDRLDGIDIVNWMINMDLTHEGKFIPKNFSFNVHSANPVGAKNIECLLNNYLQRRDNNG